MLILWVRPAAAANGNCREYDMTSDESLRSPSAMVAHRSVLGLLASLAQLRATWLFQPSYPGCISHHPICCQEIAAPSSPLDPSGRVSSFAMAKCQSFLIFRNAFNPVLEAHSMLLAAASLTQSILITHEWLRHDLGTPTRGLSLLLSHSLC